MSDITLSAPFISWGDAAVVVAVLAITGMIMLLRDQHARDAGWTHSLGSMLIAIAASSAIFVAAWNLAVGIGAMNRHQYEFAVASPTQR